MYKLYELSVGPKLNLLRAKLAAEPEDVGYCKAAKRHRSKPRRQIIIQHSSKNMAKMASGQGFGFQDLAHGPGCMGLYYKTPHGLQWHAIIQVRMYVQS